MRIALVLLCALLTACASGGARDAPDRAAFFLVSQGRASLLYRVFGGGLDYCKVTTFNLGSTDYAVDLRYDGETCAVEATTASQE